MTATCDNCASQVQLDVEDRPYQQTDEPSGQILQVSVGCPVCKKIIAIKRPVAQTALNKLALEHRPA